MSARTRRAALLSGLGVLVVLVLLLGAWAVDSAVSSGHVRRNVELAGRQVGGLSEDDLDAVVAELAEEHRSTPVTIATPALTLEATAGELGLAVDEAATTDAVLGLDDGGSILARPLRWLGSLFGERTVALSFTVDPEALTTATAELVAANQVDPVEPAMVLTDGTLVTVPGTDGTGLAVDELPELLTAAATAAQTGPVEVDLEATVLPTAHDDAEVQAVVADANAATDAPLSITVGGSTRAIDTATQRTWAVMVDDGGGGLGLTWDSATIEGDVLAAFADVGAPVTQLSWAVTPEGVTFTEGTPGTACCEADSAARVMSALGSGAPAVTLDLTVAPPDHDAEWARSMQIVEPIASFTTPHPAGQPRVENIHRMADTVRGVVIPPGETFSINEHVGKRTVEKGYVEDGVIYDGKLTKDVGGGVSQFATTLFNAAFFGGMDIDEYQMHTLYISRYPYGREATLSYPSPDLKITNVSPYGILIWPTYTGSSITVTLYSTPYVVGEQTNQTKSAAGVCTRVVTERTRTWLTEDRTETDTFRVLYQPADGVKC